MNRHLRGSKTKTFWEVGDLLRFRGSGRGSKKIHCGVVRAVIIPYVGIFCRDRQEILDEYPRSRIAFDPSIVGRNGLARHYLVDVCGTLYRPALSTVRHV